MLSETKQQTICLVNRNYYFIDLLTFPISQEQLGLHIFNLPQQFGNKLMQIYSLIVDSNSSAESNKAFKKFLFYLGHMQGHTATDNNEIQRFLLPIA